LVTPFLVALRGVEVDMVKVKPLLKDQDLRVLDYHLRKGLIREEDLKESLQQLPDEADNATWIDVKMEQVERRLSQN